MLYPKGNMFAYFSNSNQCQSNTLFLPDRHGKLNLTQRQNMPTSLLYSMQNTVR